MRLRPRLFQKAAQLMDQYSQYNPSPLTMKQFIDFGGNASQQKSYLFLRKELPVRLANIMKELSLLPENLRATPSVRLVASWYRQSFDDLVTYINQNPELKTVTDFTSDLEVIRDRHQSTVETMAQGVIELRDEHGLNHNVQNQIQYFLDRFFMSRISIRMLINQHTLLFGTSLASHPRHIGCIDPSCDIACVVKDAYDSARFLCDHYYMTGPELRIVTKNDPSHKCQDVSIVYVPSHLYHIIFELFKNSMRAVVEHHGLDNDLPPIDVLVCRGSEDVTIKVSDQGGGVPRSRFDLMSHYMYSTAPSPPSPKSGADMAPLAGYGYGLPISRLYAKYFHGDLSLFSVDGYGTDALVNLKVLTAEAEELLPVFSATSQKQYTNNIPVGDWSDPQHTTGLHATNRKQLHTKPKPKAGQ